jgi:hypothetical protein
VITKLKKSLLTRAKYSHISVCAKHLNMWEAGSIYLSLHFYHLSPGNPGAQTAPSWMTCPLPKTWQGPSLNITAMFEQERLSPSLEIHPSTSFLCQLKAAGSLMGSTKQSGQLLMMNSRALVRNGEDWDKLRPFPSPVWWPLYSHWQLHGTRRKPWAGMMYLPGPVGRET